MPTGKSQVQSVLNRAGLYHRVKTSSAYDWYWRIVDRSILDDRDAEVTFYKSVLAGFPSNGLVFDVGANHGAKTDTFLRIGARVIAIEPDELNQDILRQKFLTYRLFKKPVTVVGKALSEKDATQIMWIDEPGSAKNTLSQKWVETLRVDASRFGEALGFSGQKAVTTTTLDQLIAAHGVPYYVKIDVEGHEPSVIRGLHRPVPFLSFEVNLPEFQPEGLECIELLGRLSADGRFNFAADCRKGLSLERWAGAEAFAKVLAACEEKSVEVFWKT